MEEIQSISAEIDKLNPNLKAGEKLETVKQRLQSLNKDFEDTKSKAQTFSTRFNEVKQERYNRVHVD